MKRWIPPLLRAWGCLPLPLAHAIGWLAGTLFAWLPNTKRRDSRTNIRLCLPAWPESRRRWLVRRSLQESGKILAEAPILWFGSRARVLGLVRAVEGEAALKTAFAEGRGVILASPHLGAWELAGLYCSAHYPMTILYRPQHGLVEASIQAARARFGATVVPADRRAVRALQAALARGEAVGVLPDQAAARNTGVYAPFFGMAASTLTLLPRLAQRTGAAVVFVYAERLPRGRGFHLHFRRGRPDIGDADVVRGATALNADIEACIRECPEQYWWSYRRFRRRPRGAPRLYRHRR